MQNEFRTYLRKERLQKINLDWQYLKPWQKASLFLKAVLWSLPTITQILECHRERVLVRMTYRLYKKAHWM
jgi:hypothetical protein